jgi:proline iminopeptidase
MDGQHISIGDTGLYIVERGQGYPLIVLHGGPGLDHHEFGNYLDALTDHYRLILVDQRSQGRSELSPPETWTLKQMAQDVVLLAEALGLSHYAVLGHSYGAFVALQNAVDFPGRAGQTIVSSGVPSGKYLESAAANLERFEPLELRQQIVASMQQEGAVQTQADFARLMHDQWPFHFANPLDPRIQELESQMADSVFSPAMLQHFASQGYGGFEIEDQLARVTQPTLVLAGRHDRSCTAEASEATAQGIPGAELHIFESSGHMAFVEENAAYVEVVRRFLDQHSAAVV